MMRRRRNGRLYHVFIGGGIEPGESLVQAAHREAKEETSLDIVLGPHLWTRELFIPAHELILPEETNHREHAFLVTKFSGWPQLGAGPERLNQSPDNQYQLEWLPLTRVNSLSLFPAPIDVNYVLAVIMGEA